MSGSRLALVSALFFAACGPEEPANTAPTAAGQAAATPEDTALDGTVTGSDAEGDALTFSVATSPAHGTLTLSASGDFVFTPEANYHGSDRFTFTASDGEESSSPASVELTITPENDTPSAAAVSLGEGPYDTDDTITAVASGWSDADGDPEGYQYAWYVNDALVDPVTGASLDGSHFSRGDTVHCVVTPTDGAASGAAVISAAVTIENSLPAAQSASLGGAPLYTASTASCTSGGGSDADGDPVSFRFAWRVNGAAIAGEESATLAGDLHFAKGDSVACVATPFDGTGEGAAITSAALVVQNSVPTFEGISLGAGPYFTDDGVTCATSGFGDPDGDPEGYLYEWLVNDVPVPGETSATLSGVSSFSRGDAVRCQAAPFDGEAAGLVLASTPVVIQNSPPLLTRSSVAPGIARTDDAVTCVAAEWSDPDGDEPVSFTFEWLKNDLAITDQTAPTLSGSDHFDRGDSIACVLSISDGSAWSQPVRSDPLVVQNTAPVLTSVSLGDGPYGTEDVVPCTPEADPDEDGDPISFSYEWLRNGAVIAGQSGDTLEGATQFDSGDLISCRVTPSDGLESGAAVTSPEVSIGGSPPSFSGASLGAGPYYTDDTLTVTTSGFTDPDGDPEGYLYQWFRNDVAISGETGASLSGLAAFDKGDGVYCSVTATDGTFSGNTLATNTVVIENSPPTLSSASLGSMPLFTDSTAFCNASGYSDPDGDFGPYLYEWIKNGLVIDGQVSATLEGNLHFDRDDVIECRVTASDGSLTSAPVTSSPVTIQNSVPVVWGGHLGTFVDLTADGAVLFSDEDGDPLTFTVLSLPASGTLDVLDAALGTFRFTPGAGFEGRTSWSFRVSDGDATVDRTGTLLVKRPRRLSRGDRFGCAAGPDGVLRCWGANESGQLGNGTRDESSTPVAEASGFTDWVSVSASVNAASTGYGVHNSMVGHTCGLRADASLYCWGRNAERQLGISGTDDVLAPTPGAPGKWFEISAGGLHTCAVAQDLSAWCWGSNRAGQLGRGSIGSSGSGPVRVGAYGDLTGWVTVTAGDEHSCGIKVDGSLHCWGEGYDGQLANGETGAQAFETLPRQISHPSSDWREVSAGIAKTCAVRSEGTFACWGAVTSPDATVPYHIGGLDTDFVSVDVGSTGYCARISTGELWCGTGTFGAGKMTSPLPLDGSTDWTGEIAMGQEGGCAMKSDGTTWCWGGNMMGETGTGTDQSNLAPEEIAVGSDWRQLTGRFINDYIGVQPWLGRGTVGTRTDGTVWSAGTAASAGDGDSSGHNVFTEAAGGVTSWATVAATRFTTCATRTDGSLWCWPEGGAYTPTQIGTDVDWAQGELDLSLAGTGTCARKTSGALYCWGNNSLGQLGVGDRTSRAAPTEVAGAQAWTAVAGGNDHFCAIRSDGTLWCWGSNRYGQLGVDPADSSDVPMACESRNACSPTPLQVGAASDWVSVTSGDGHSCAVNAAGNLFCWGRNDLGQVGSGVLGPVRCNSSSILSCSPTPVDLGGGFAEAYAGRDHTCARLTTGAVACWGRNTSGQLGDGTTADSLSPVELLGGAGGFVDVAPQDEVTCALRDDGGGGRRLWCWGRSLQGAFGDGNSHRPAPVQALVP